MILNLTPFKANRKHVEAGVTDVSKEDLNTLIDALLFMHPPTQVEVWSRTIDIARIGKKYGAIKAMIAAPSFMISQLERTLWAYDIAPVYAFYTDDGYVFIDAPNMDDWHLTQLTTEN